MIDSFGDRLQKARRNAGYKTADDALAIFRTWNEHTYKSHESSKRTPKIKDIEKYAKAYKVRLEWLALHSGEMLLERSGRAVVGDNAPQKDTETYLNMTEMEQAAAILAKYAAAARDASQNVLDIVVDAINKSSSNKPSSSKAKKKL